MRDTLVLPDYEKPPVVEVVCGLMFEPIRELTTAHIGLLWQKFKDTYSKCTENPPLPQVIENFGERESSQPTLSGFGLPSFLLPRIWFERRDGRGLIQVQRDRFHHNWKKAEEADEYPHYGNVFGNFRRYLDEFESFLRENELNTVVPSQYEMTYVNHIPEGEGWTSPETVDLFPDLGWRKKPDRFLPPFEQLNMTWSFVLPEKAGRLHMAISRGVRVKDQRRILVFNITARGIGHDRSLAEMSKWFDVAHEWIVCGFTDVTNEEVQRNIWKRIR